MSSCVPTVKGVPRSMGEMAPRRMRRVRLLCGVGWSLRKLRLRRIAIRSSERRGDRVVGHRGHARGPLRAAPLIALRRFKLAMNERIGSTRRPRVAIDGNAALVNGDFHWRTTDLDERGSTVRQGGAGSFEPHDCGCPSSSKTVLVARGDEPHGPSGRWRLGHGRTPSDPSAVPPRCA